MIGMIVLRTNEEINRKLPTTQNPDFYMKTVDSIELKAFFGLLYFNGVQKHNHQLLNEMWSPQFGYNFYRAKMPRNRFSFINGDQFRGIGF